MVTHISSKLPKILYYPLFHFLSRKIPKILALTLVLFLLCTKGQSLTDEAVSKSQCKIVIGGFLKKKKAPKLTPFIMIILATLNFHN